MLTSFLSFVEPGDQCESLSRFYVSRKLNLPISNFKKEQYVTRTHVCALNPETGTDACSEDSGGPLMLYNERLARWYLAGIVSGSYDLCGKSTDVLGLYTDATMFHDFLKQHVPGSCSPELSEVI